MTIFIFFFLIDWGEARPITPPSGYASVYSYFQVRTLDFRSRFLEAEFTFCRPSNSVGSEWN